MRIAMLAALLSFWGSSWTPADLWRAFAGPWSPSPVSSSPVPVSSSASSPSSSWSASGDPGTIDPGTDPSNPGGQGNPPPSGDGGPTIDPDGRT